MFVSFLISDVFSRTMTNTNQLNIIIDTNQTIAVLSQIIYKHFKIFNIIIIKLLTIEIIFTFMK